MGDLSFYYVFSWVKFGGGFGSGFYGYCLGRCLDEYDIVFLGFVCFSYCGFGR